MFIYWTSTLTVFYIIWMFNLTCKPSERKIYHHCMDAEQQKDVEAVYTLVTNCSYENKCLQGEE